MKFDWSSYTGSFFDIATTEEKFLMAFDDRVLRMDFTLQGEYIEHERAIYTFLDLIGDLGGVHDLIVLFFSVFMSSISEHSFVSKAIGLLYLVKTKREDIFKQPL